MAKNLAVDVLARIPFDRTLARAADEGTPFLEGSGASTAAGRAFAALAERVVSFDCPEWEVAS
jgi:hypothetical protein